MKSYVHARLGKAERDALDEVTRETGRSESAILRRGLRLAIDEARRQQNALTLAGPSVGRFKKGPRDLSTNPRHLDEFGQ